MTLNLKIRNDIDRFLVYFSFLEMLILRWILIGQNTIIFIYCTVILIRLSLLTKSKQKTLYGNILLLLITFIYIILNTELSDKSTGGMLCSNMIYLIEPLTATFYFGYLLNNRLDLLEEIFLKLRLVLNAYYMINFIIILLQRGKTYFLMPVSRIENAYYPDHMAGLLGIDGTHRLALVTVFIILLNYYYMKNSALDNYKKIINICYLLIIVVTALYSSSLNDNNMVYVLIPAFLLLFYMIDYRNTRGNLFKLIVVGVIGIVLLYLLFNTSLFPAFSNIRIYAIVKDFFGMFNQTGTGDERMLYVLLALTKYKGFFGGSGFGVIQMRQDPAIIALGYDYRNWGMSDIAPFIAMGGLAYYIWMLMLNARIFVTNHRYKKLKKYILIIMLILTYYHQVLTHPTMTIPMCWIIALFYMVIARSQSQISSASH